MPSQMHVQLEVFHVCIDYNFLPAPSFNSQRNNLLESRLLRTLAGFYSKTAERSTEKQEYKCEVEPSMTMSPTLTVQCCILF